MAADVMELSGFGAVLTVEVPPEVGSVLASDIQRLPGLALGPASGTTSTLACEFDTSSSYRITNAGAHVATAESPEEAARHVLSEAEHELAAASPLLVVVHAGVVARGGNALLVPGRSHAGKSSAVTALLRLGWAYFSDDYALVSADGRVHPYPRPIGVRRSGRTSVVDPRQFGASVGVGAATVAAVIFTRFVPGGGFVPNAVSPGEGVLRMLDHCLQSRTDPERALTALQAVAEQASFWEGVRGEADDFAEAVTALLTRDRRS